MEFLTLFIQIIMMVLMVIFQLFVWVLKLVPVWFFFWLIKKLLVGWQEIVNMLLTSKWITLLMIFFIIIMWYIILIGLLHLVININIFSHFISFNEQNKLDNNWQNKKVNFTLNYNVVKWFITSFMSSVKALRWIKASWDINLSRLSSNNDSIIKKTEMVKNNALLSIVLFQWWLLPWKEAFHKLIEKFWKWTNIFFLLVIVWVLVFILNLKQEYKLNNWESVMISNGYDYFKHATNNIVVWQASSVVSSKIAYMKWLLNESLTFRDERIKLIAKMYYYTFGMKYLSSSSLVETKSTFNPISLTINSDSTQDPEKQVTYIWGKKTSLNNILSKEQKQLAHDSLKNWWTLTLYADELVNLLWKKDKITKYPDPSDITSCINTVNNSSVKQTYFLPNNIFNSTLYKNESWGEKYSGDVFKGVDAAVLTDKWLTTIRASVIDRLTKRIEASVPWTNKNLNEASIGLYFILWKSDDGQKYIIDKTLYENFKKEFSANQIEGVWKRINNIKMLKNRNTLITDFCYWFATFKKLNGALNINSWLNTENKHSSQFDINVPFINYDDFLAKLFSKFETLVDNEKNKKLPEVERLELAYHLFSSLDIRLRTGFSESTILWADSLKDFFYMFNKDQKMDFFVGSLFIKQWLEWDWGLKFFLERFQSYTAEKDNLELNEMMQSPVVQDIFGKYLWLDSWLKNFYYTLIDTIKEKYKVVPWWAVFNINSLDLIKNKFFGWYRWETGWYLFGGSWILTNNKIQELIYSMQNEIKVSNWLSTSSNLDWDKDEKTDVFFGESYSSVFWWEDGLTYKKNWIMIGLIPIVQSDVPFMNYLLFIVYLIAYLMMLVFVIWFSWIGQIIYNYILSKKTKWNVEANFVWTDELRDLLIRLILFIIFMRIYFILTTF